MKRTGGLVAVDPGAGSFTVHPGHAFDGPILTVRDDGREVAEARCECGAVLCTTEAVFVTCPECGGKRSMCLRCGGDGRVVDHAALVWRSP